jgi:hypothetical protein
MVRMVYAGSAYERRGGRFAVGVACAGGMDKHRRLLLPLPLGGYRPTLRGLILQVYGRMPVKTGIGYRTASKGITPRSYGSTVGHSLSVGQLPDGH